MATIGRHWTFWERLFISKRKRDECTFKPLGLMEIARRSWPHSEKATQAWAEMHVLESETLKDIITQD